MGRLQKIVPVIRLAQLGANPQIRVIVAPTGATAELAHTIEHIGNRHARAGNRRRRFGGESQVERGALGSGQITGNLTQRAGTPKRSNSTRDSSAETTRAHWRRASRSMEWASSTTQ